MQEGDRTVSGLFNVRVNDVYNVPTISPSPFAKLNPASLCPLGANGSAFDLAVVRGRLGASTDDWGKLKRRERRSRAEMTNRALTHTSNMTLETITALSDNPVVGIASHCDVTQSGPDLT
jgi:hypothetical protein